MPYDPHYHPAAPARAALERASGLVLLEFGTGWCGHCQAAQAAIAAALEPHAHIAHHKVEDGPGRALGRSYRVKLWPTLILLRDGVEVGRLVRPLQPQEVLALLQAA